MIMGFQTIGRGMSALQEIYGNVSNNIANAQTVAFKKGRVEIENMFPIYFEEAIAEAAEENFDPRLTRKKLEIGTGSQVVKLSRDFSQGTIEVTKNQLDIAIQGEGFLRFQKPDGTIVYSRAGNLKKDKHGYMVNTKGYLLDPPIQIPSNSASIQIDSYGKVTSILDKGNSHEIGQILLARFDNPAEMNPMGSNLYSRTQASGAPHIEEPGRHISGAVAQFSLESSNVNVIHEMMQMVINQRNFAAATKAFQVTDAIMRAGTV